MGDTTALRVRRYRPGWVTLPPRSLPLPSWMSGTTTLGVQRYCPGWALLPPWMIPLPPWMGGTCPECTTLLPWMGRTTALDVTLTALDG